MTDESGRQHDYYPFKRRQMIHDNGRQYCSISHLRFILQTTIADNMTLLPICKADDDRELRQTRLLNPSFVHFCPSFPFILTFRLSFSRSISRSFNRCFGHSGSLSAVLSAFIKSFFRLVLLPLSVSLSFSASL